MNARISIQAYKAAKRAEESFSSRWQDYETQKQQWMRTHPDAKHSEYEAAMRVIANRCGV